MINERSTVSDKPRLIVTADDFGASAEVNEAIVRASREGILRFASLMVAEPAAKEAVERARRECPRLIVGLHVVLCDGRSVLSHQEIPELVNAQGQFSDNPVSCGLRYFFDASLRSALEREIRAQFERFLEFGLAPSHVDGHVNIQVHPIIYPMLARLSKEYGFRRMRLPGGEFCLSMRYSVRPFWKQMAEGLIFSLLRTYLLKAYADPRIEVADRTLGLLRSGLMGESYIIHCLSRLPPGTTEIYFHPSSDPLSEATNRPNPTHRTLSDLQTLLSADVHGALALRGIELLGDG